MWQLTITHARQIDTEEHFIELKQKQTLGLLKAAQVLYNGQRLGFLT